MKYRQIPNTDLQVSTIALGCYRLYKKTQDEAQEIIQTAIDQGINFFDNADVYGAGKSEEYLGIFIKNHPELRKQMIIQTKCDITPGGCPGKTYDTSKEYIFQCVEKALKRLNTDYLDILLLHRPDAIMDPMEVAETFEELHQKGLVRYFGVSNHTSLQIEVLQKYLDLPIIVNQIELSLVHTCALDSRIFTNDFNEYAIVRDSQILDYCMLKDITIQAWSPMLASWTEGTFLDNERYPKLNKMLEDKAKKYNVKKNAIAIAWILRHPYHIQPIVGTMSPTHLKEICQATNIDLTRQDWYDLYLSEEKPLP